MDRRKKRRTICGIEAEWSRGGWCWQHLGYLWLYSDNGDLAWGRSAPFQQTAWVPCLKVAIGFCLGWSEAVLVSPEATVRHLELEEQVGPREQAPKAR
jgi:hypothetical protein